MPESSCQQPGLPLHLPDQSSGCREGEVAWKGQEGDRREPWPLLWGSSQPCLIPAWLTPGSPPALKGGTVTSWDWFFTRQLMTSQTSWAALVMAPPISLVALPHLPAPISRSGISESSGSQIPREGRQTSPFPAHQNPSDPLPFGHRPSCPSPSLSSALPVLTDNS